MRERRKEKERILLNEKIRKRNEEEWTIVELMRDYLLPFVFPLLFLIFTSILNLSQKRAPTPTPNLRFFFFFYLNSKSLFSLLLFICLHSGLLLDIGIERLWNHLILSFIPAEREREKKSARLVSSSSLVSTAAFFGLKKLLSFLPFHYSSSEFFHFELDSSFFPTLLFSI